MLYGQKVGNQFRFTGINMPPSGVPTAYAIRVTYDTTTYRVTEIEYVNKPADVTGILGIMYYRFLHT